MASVDALVLLVVLAALGFLVGGQAAAARGTRAAPPGRAARGGRGRGRARVGLLEQQARKCGKQRCRGLKKAVELDIQLETEECVRGRPTPAARSALLTAVGAARRSSRTSRRR
ncbi:hypothetical protein ACQJBY_064851 [Aegilops geniculata]